MWHNIAGIILRNRIAILILLGLFTGLMAYKAGDVRVFYGLPSLLPKHDSTYISYEKFQERFGHEEAVIVIGIEENPLDDIKLFNNWYDLGQQLKKIEGVDTVISVANIITIEKSTGEKRFLLKPVIKRKPQKQEQFDSLAAKVRSLPFYRELLYNDSTEASLMALTINRKIFESKDRADLMKAVMGQVSRFEKEQNIQVRISGLPFIRTVITEMVRSELQMFIILAVLVTIVILFLFFRSFKPVAVSMLVVILGVIWSLGTLALFDFQITILTSIIPPLIIVIGIPNCIFLINKYHHEFKTHGNKVKALTRVVEKIGAATFMTNTTTAAGFATFIFTQSMVLVEFGVIASVNILVIFMLSILLIPIIFSFLDPPKTRHVKHLDNKWVHGAVDTLAHIVQNHRKAIYIISGILVLTAFYGISKVQFAGNIVDDLPKSHFVSRDLAYFEKHFKGVMPFEISIDAKKKGMVSREHNLKKIDQLQDVLAEYSEFSRPLSITEGVKFIKQAYYNGNEDKYALINNQEKVFFKAYMDHAMGNQDWLSAFIDSTKQHTRISVKMADIGTRQMDALITELRPKVDAIFPPDKYDVHFTGTSVVFLAGTNYLVKNLFISLGIAVVIISFIMAMLFSSFRMIMVSIAINMVPLLFAAAMMGFFKISIKPSTILVFSIAFGISVDDTIHFLAKYRQDLRLMNQNIGLAALAALKETGVSMIYTSIILFFGFSVFASSEFGGTMALGVLVSFTLLVAMLVNLILLPAFLLTMERAITTKAFQEPFLEIMDEEEDIELDALRIKRIIKEEMNGDAPELPEGTEITQKKPTTQ